MAGFSFDDLDKLLSDRVRSRDGSAKRSSPELASVARIARGAPEVMVKITGNCKGGEHIGAHLDYTSRNGKIDLETNDGEVLDSKSAVKDFVASWGDDLGAGRSKKRRDTTNIMLSMKEGAPPEKVKSAARDFAAAHFDNFEYVMALHTDTKNPHVHLTVKNLGYDQTRLHVPKGKTQEWRESFASHLRQHGVEAEATQRIVRGVTRKGTAGVVKQMLKRQVQPEVIKQKIEEARADKARSTQSSVWRSKIQTRQEKARRDWEALADILEKTDTELAVSVRLFVDKMPPIETESEALSRAVKLRDKGPIEQESER